MDIGNLRQGILEAIRSVAPETDPARIDPGLPLLGQIELDSLDRVHVALALQERMGVAIPESEVGPAASLDSILAYACAKAGDTAPGVSGGHLGGVPGMTPAAPRRTCHEVKGETVTVRPIGREDRSLEAEFVRHLSDNARYKRFMLTLRELSPAKLDYLTDVDQVRHVALIATVEREGRTVPVGIVRYVVDAAGTGCEFSVAIDDAWQRSGLAGILMRELMAIARAAGLETMEGIVLAANTAMLHFARQLGFVLERDPDDRTTVRVVRRLR